ncbi:MAG: hypothetical protein WB613_03635, partial [Pseudolabrys sp.]
ADVLIAGDGQATAFRGSDGRLAVLHSGRDSFAIKEWLAADADARTPKDPSLANGVTCDAIGCIGRLGDGGSYRLFWRSRLLPRIVRAQLWSSARERRCHQTVWPPWSIGTSGGAAALWPCVGWATDSSKPSRFRRTMIARGGTARPLRRPIRVFR